MKTDVEQNRFTEAEVAEAKASVKANTDKLAAAVERLAGSETAKAEPPQERMLKWFEFAHLPPHLANVSETFYRSALTIVANVAPGPERTVALRKLLESKDAAVRAVVHPGG